MHLKFRRNKALLYRSVWVPKASAGNTHGFSQQDYVGSIALDGQVIPNALIQRLTDAEMAFVEAKICSPARERAAEQRRIEERRERDPGWRLEEATTLISEAAERSVGQPVTAVAADRLREAIDQLRLTENLEVPKAACTTDPMADALSAVRSAAQAVASGHYGRAPTEGVRNTRTYQLWSQLFDAVQGEAGGSLLRALQAKGFVKKRGG